MKSESGHYPGCLRDLHHIKTSVGELMYGMVHTIMYALDILSRYGNNLGPRHIEFLKHLLKYCKYAKLDRLKFATHDGPIETMTQALQLKF